MTHESQIKENTNLDQIKLTVKWGSQAVVETNTWRSWEGTREQLLNGSVHKTVQNV